MKSIGHLFAVFFAFLAGSMLCGRAEVGTAEMGEKIRAAREKYSIMGLSIVAVKNGQVLWRTNFGWADFDRKIPVTDATKFRIASISKTITATALMQLWERGRFKLDDDISRYLGYSVVNPRFPDQPITFRHLLTHTSSFKDGATYDQFLQLTYEAPERALNLKELLSEGGSHYNNGAIYSEHTPGTHYHYSNLAFGLLGTLVEKITGQRFDVYTEKNIFKPLGLKASFNASKLPDINQLAVLYRPGTNGWMAQTDDHRGVRPADRGGKKYEPGKNALVFSPQGGLRASALDIAKFMTQFSHPSKARKAILKPATVQMMLSEQWTNRKTGTAYVGRGLGFQRTPDVVANELWLGHSGNAYGLQSDMYFQEGDGIGIVLMTNGSRPGKSEEGFTEMERAIFDAVLEWVR